MDIAPKYKTESSKLYHLEPIKEKNMLQESLTGYIARLAHKHLMDVGQLINYELVPVLHKEYLNRIAVFGGTRFYNNASMLNGVGQTPIQFVSALQELTLRQDLVQCTFYPWRHIIPSRGLISSVKKWCPICYEEALENGTEIYEPLNWVLQSVTACSMHGTKLITHCPYCKKELRLLDRHSQPGFCNYCKHWLGNKNTITSATEDELTIADQVDSLISFSSKAHLANKRCLTVFLKRCAGQLNGGMAELARLLGFPKTTLWDWCREKSNPSLPQLLSIGSRLKINIVDVLFEKYLKIEIEIPKLSSPPSFEILVRNRISQDKLKDILDHYIRETSIPFSMNSVAKKVNISRKVFENYFPDLCKSISHRYVSFTEKQATAKKTQRKTEIHKICEILIKQGTYPSRRNVEKLASWKAALRNPEIQKEWKSIIYGLNPSDS